MKRIVSHVRVSSAALLAVADESGCPAVRYS